MAARTVQVVSLLLVLASAGDAETPEAPPDPSSYLPAATAPRGVGEAGKILRYGPGELHRYLNGAAPVLEEYGIERVAIREWVREGRALAIHVYRMKDATGAWGLATYLRGPGSKPLDLGDGGYETAARLGFHRGRWYVQCDVQEGGAAVLAEARRLGGAMAKALPGRAEPPAVLGVLRSSTMVARSEVLHRGKLSLTTAEPFAGVLDGEGLVLAGSARYRHGTSRARGLVADYETEAAASRAFARLRRALSVEGNSDLIAVKAGRERVLAWRKSRRIRVVVD